MKLMLSTASVHARIVTVMLLVVLALVTILRVGAAQPEREAQVALDKVAIMELAARFENTFDAGDVEGHLDTWVDDLSFESPFGNCQGKDAYRAWVTEFNRVAMASG